MANLQRLTFVQEMNDTDTDIIAIIFQYTKFPGKNFISFLTDTNDE